MYLQHERCICVDNTLGIQNSVYLVHHSLWIYAVFKYGVEEYRVKGTIIERQASGVSNSVILCIRYDVAFQAVNAGISSQAG